MKQSHLWIVCLMVQLLPVCPSMGQDQGTDSTYVEDSRLYKRNWQESLDQPLFQLEGPAILNRGETLFGTSTYSKEPSFKFNPGQIPLNSLSKASTTLFVPRYPGIGDYQNYGGTLGRVSVTEKLTIDYGAFISAQYGYMQSSRQIVFGSNYLLRYSLSNKLYFQSWGQFVSPGKRDDPTFDLPDFFPKSHFGAGLLFDSNSNTQLDMGVEYQYDQLNKIWKPESGGKVRLKF